jgi:hypothetical protein
MSCKVKMIGPRIGTTKSNKKEHEIGPPWGSPKLYNPACPTPREVRGREVVEIKYFGRKWDPRFLGFFIGFSVPEKENDQ